MPELHLRARRSSERATDFVRRLPVGVEPIADGVHARVWAPDRQRVVLQLEGDHPGAVPLEPDGRGYFAAWLPGVGAGARYRFRLDDDPTPYPDPASRFQPEGPHGASQVVDATRFGWTDDDWRGLDPDAQIAYELHIGTFTPDGTWAAAAAKLPLLAELGVTAVEVMPVAAFPGRFGWGYDGVDLFAPTQLYGTPDDFRGFVDAAHHHGLGVVLDVVYNHLGPDGNYLRQYANAYFTHAHTTEWGDAINFDGSDAEPVREFFVSNARYWIEEFHLDGLRLDATQSIFDESPTHILAEVADAVRDAGRRAARSTWVAAENEPQHAWLARPRSAGGAGLDALWNDDFHHAALVALTGRDEAYFSDFRGSAREFVAAAKHGFLFQGQRFLWQKKPRGTPALDLPPTAFVHFLENHDQVANSVRGERLAQLSSPGRVRALTALLLLGPQTPLLFQGQEFGASAPFLYFADHEGELARLVRRGRADFLSQFPSIAAPDVRAALADPGDPATFTRCRLDWSERDARRPTLALHRDLITLRRGDRALRGPLDAAVLDEHAFVLRYFGGDDGDRLLCVNLGGPLHFRPLPEPLLAPPVCARWREAWSSEDTEYGGRGAASPDAGQEGWGLAGESAVLLVSEPADRGDRRA